MRARSGFRGVVEVVNVIYVISALDVISVADVLLAVNTFRKPKVLYWTAHSRAKMRFYGLSEQRVRRVIHSPRRIQEGIAPHTIAIMQPNAVISDKRPIRRTQGKHMTWDRGVKKILTSEGGAGRGEMWKQEIWVMIKEEKARRKIISAWRYPGMTKPGDPLPPEIIRELRISL